MNVEIIDRPLRRTLVGAAAPHDPAKCYGDEIHTLLGPVWRAIQSQHVPHKGLNHALYYADCSLFCGVEADLPDPAAAGLIARTLDLSRYAYYKHVGPYSKLAQVGAGIAAELKRRRLRHGFPVVEVYGHWNDDESKLETEVIFPLEG